MVNKVILIGNVGVDPEIRATENGKVARIRLATTERYRDRATNENREHTEWHTVTLWRGLADVVDRFVHKGSQLYIEGRLRTREWTDQSGNKRYTTEIMADTMNLLGRRDNRQENDGGGYRGNDGGNYRGNDSGGYRGNDGGGYRNNDGGYRNSNRNGGYNRQQQNAPETAPAAAPVPPAPAEDPDDLPF